MDLASLKAEIERKRKNVESMNVLLPEKKFFRRGDLEAKHEEAYWKNYYSKSNDNSSKTSSSTNDTDEKTTTLNEKFQLPPRTDVIKKLRERNQPILLFGETDLDSYRRLRLLETTEPELKGQRNDFKAGKFKKFSISIKNLIIFVSFK
jgi:pre-mRNA-splicing factor 18